MRSKIAVYDSYLKMIKNAVGTKMFRSFYLNKNGRNIDITKNGNLSCAFFASNVLLIWGLISEGHATVTGTTKDMEKNGWKKILKNKAKPGDVIIWERNSKNYFHNGFYIGNNRAVSNDSDKGIPVVHEWDYSGKRKIISVYTYPKFK